MSFASEPSSQTAEPSAVDATLDLASVGAPGRASRSPSEAVASTSPRATLSANRSRIANLTTAASVENDPAHPDSDDHALMLSVRAGDLARLGVLFERHHRPLYGFFVRTTRQASASEDLVQTVFLRILKYRHTYRDDGKFTTWMYQLARHAAADHFRKTAAAPRLFEKPEDIHDFEDLSPSADEQATRADDLERMRRALARLPDEQRELLTLQRFQRLRHDELAEIYGCSIGAMKVRVHRAVAALRDSFFSL